MPERDVHLLLSQNAAKVLDGTIENVLFEYEDIDGILGAISRDLKDQIEQPKKKKKRPKK